jgi:Uncharacterized conserved protein
LGQFGGNLTINPGKTLQLVDSSLALNGNNIYNLSSTTLDMQSSSLISSSIGGTLYNGDGTLSGRTIIDNWTNGVNLNNASGTITLGGTYASNVDPVTIENHDTFTFKSTAEIDSTVSVTITNALGATMTIESGADLQTNTAGSTSITNAGTLYLGSVKASSSNGLTITNTGTIIIQAACSSDKISINNQGGTVTFTNSFTMNNGGIENSDDGTITINGNITIPTLVNTKGITTVNGSLNLTGPSGDASAEGTIIIGGGGTLTIQNGNLPLRDIGAIETWDSMTITSVKAGVDTILDDLTHYDYIYYSDDSRTTEVSTRLSAGFSGANVVFLLDIAEASLNYVHFYAFNLNADNAAAASAYAAGEGCTEVVFIDDVTLSGNFTITDDASFHSYVKIPSLLSPTQSPFRVPCRSLGRITSAERLPLAISISARTSPSMISMRTKSRSAFS